MERFRVEDLNEAVIGLGWKTRIVYEILRTPRLIERAGGVRPARPSDLQPEDVALLKSGLGWSPATTRLHLAALRRFLRWARHPLASRATAWAVPSGSAERRRWLGRVQLRRLYRAARGRERVLLALEGFNGLRRVEVLRLHLKDVDFDRRRLRVLGKGRNGGKWRTLPMLAETANVLQRETAGLDGESPVMPVSRSGADLLLQRAARRAGFVAEGVRVSHHDLRRTFGRLAHQAGMDLVQLKNLYGHTSLDQTVHYIGLDEDEMRAGLDRLALFIGPVGKSESASPANPPKGP